MPAPKRLLIVIAQILTIALLGFLIGWLVGNPLLIVSLTLAAFLIWALWTKNSLQDRLESSSATEKASLGIKKAALLKSEKELSKDKKRSQRVLKALRASSKALPEGAILINSLFEVQWVNVKAENYLGIRDTDYQDVAIDELIDKPDFLTFIKKSTEDSEQHNEFLFSSPINEQQRLRIIAIPSDDQYTLLSVQDVSLFYRINKMRQNFIDNASHELRSPLTVIRGYLDEVLESDSLSEYWQKPMREIDRQTTRMQNIIEDMLTLSRLESRTQLAGQKPVELKHLVTLICNDLKLATKNSHSLKIQVSAGLTILGEESELYSVISNLIKNAIYYSPVGTSVDITWAESEQYGQLIVADNGIGIPEESIKQLTERFYRVDDGRSREQGGTGLGLAIVKHALMRHDAYLSIESNVGKGSRFICHFPEQRIQQGL